MKDYKYADLGLSLALRTNQYGHSSLVGSTDHSYVFCGLGNRESTAALALAILAALGEPVEEKPDRSELDSWSEWRYIADGDGFTDFSNKGLNDLIADAKALRDCATSIYELVAYVGPKPDPTERKVVRLD